MFAQATGIQTRSIIPGRLRISVDGLKRNSGFATRLNRQLASVDGVKLVGVNVLTGRVLIHYESEKLTTAVIRQHVQTICQQQKQTKAAEAISATPVSCAGLNGDHPAKPAAVQVKQRLMTTVLTGGILAGLVIKRLMIGRSTLSSSQQIFNVAAMTTIVAGYPMLRSGIGNLVRHKKINNDLLLSAASLILLAMRESITGLSVLWLVQLSGLFNLLMQVRSQQAIKELLLGKNAKVVCLREGQPQEITAAEIQVGDELIVQSGELIAADGIIISGQATVNQAALCGEFMPIDKNQGSEVLAGMVVAAGAIHIRVTKVGGDTAAAQIVRLVNQAVSRADEQKHSGEIYSARLVPWTLGLAALLFLLTRDYRRSLAVLLAGCPAAVALSSHTTLGMAVAQAARQGIFVKDSRSIQAAEQIDTVIFDKTGTLTLVQPQLTGITSLARHLEENDLLALAAAVEAMAEHPLARMIGQAAQDRGIAIQAAHSREVYSNGVKGLVGQDQVLIGSERFMAENSVDMAPAKARVMRFQHLGSKVLYVSVNQKLAGLLGVDDSLRPESQTAVEGIRAAGITDIGVLTGDTADSANVIAKQLGLEKIWSNMLPEDKLRVIVELQQSGKKVAMIGDGINDSPAMSAAQVGIAMGNVGAGLAVQAADMVICGDDLRKVPEMLELSRSTMQVLRQNLAFAAGSSVIGIGLAAMQVISPISAALLLNFSTFGVLFNSSRLLKTDRSNRAKKPVYRQPSLDLQQFAQTPPAAQRVSPDHVATLPMGKYQAPETGQPDRGKLWHALSPATILERLESPAHYGLSEQSAKERCKQYGLNLMTEAPKTSFWRLFGDQFKDFMVKVLIGATGLSFFLGEVRDALLTSGIIIVNALLGAYQESKAEQSLDSMKKMTAPLAKVIRNGRLQCLKAEYLVPGDLIVLEAGDRIPADARLVKTSQFEVEEASLTGEALPAKKNHQFVGQDQTPLGDRVNMVFMGTNVTRGRAQAVVVATGMATEMGKIASLLQREKPEPTPLQRRLEEMGKTIVVGCLSVAAIVFITGILRGQSLLNMVRSSATIAVTAIPEGLSAIVIVALALGVRRMVKQNILVRNMASIETLGCATVICSDKTGTLTKNEMTVRKIYAVGDFWDVSGEGYSPHGRFSKQDIPVDPAVNASLMQTLLIGALCNNAKLSNSKKSCKDQVVAIESGRQKTWSIAGDPTEGALVVAAAKAGLWENKLTHSYSREREIPFESERRMMTVVCSGHEQAQVVYCKGAADSIVNACTHYLQNGSIQPLTPEICRQIQLASEQMADQALRVLATAYRPLQADEPDEALEQGLIFCGLVGMIDPPRPEVPPAIAKCKRAGVKVVMITGDHPNTAKAIARELGLLEQDGQVLTGQELERLSDEQLVAVIEDVNVYARTAPQHKLRIIKAFKKKGYVVAMTGDGVNDAPAIKAADIGIAMGIMGTDVTKEAACMTLADDNFATIVKAMEEGRSIYANIRKAIRYALATNIGEVVLMFMAALIGLPLPLIPIQLLWINLIGDGLPVIALVNDPPAQGIMEQPPRSGNDSVFSGRLGLKILTRGVIIGGAALALYAWKLASSGSLMLARTMAVAQVAVSQFAHIFDCRAEERTGKVSLLSNWALIGAVGLSMAMVAAIIYLPGLQSIFGTLGLGATDWLLVAGASAATALVDAAAVKGLLRFFPADQDRLQAGGCLSSPAV